MLVYTYRRGGIHVDLQGEEDPDHPTDPDQTPEGEVSVGEVSEIDQQSDASQSPERGVLRHNRRSVRVDDEVTFNFRV